MSNPLTIMLVDDNKIDLFIHGEVMKRIPEVGKTIQYTFAGDALKYLEENDKSLWPEVILLDIHMPILSGFDFMVSYEKFDAAFREKCKVIIVSSTLDNLDLKKAKSNPQVFAFLEKPLNTDNLRSLLNTIALT